MSACSQPPVETILRSCIATLQGVIMPELRSDWARYSGGLLIGSLEFALGLLDDDRPNRHRREVVEALEQLAPAVNGVAELSEALDPEKPYEAASALLVYAQHTPGALAEQIAGSLHPVLFRQLGEDLQAAAPLLQGNLLPRRTVDDAR